MPLVIRCPKGHKLKIPSKFAGQSVRCPACESKFEVPTQGKGKASTKPKQEQSPQQDKKKKEKLPASPVEEEPQKEKLTAASTEQAIQEEAAEQDAAAILPPPPPPGFEDPAPIPSVPQPTTSQPITTQAFAEQRAAEQAPVATAQLPEAEFLPNPQEPNRLVALMLERKLLGTEPGYRADKKQKANIYWLAAGQAALACFATIPAFWQIGAEQSAPWVYFVLMLSLLQIAYAVWICLTPDFSSAQVAMFATGTLAAIYAAATAVCWLTEAKTGGWFHIGSLKMVHGNKPALWCAAVMLLASLVAYFCGHISYRWQKAYHRLWPAKPH